MAIDPAEIKTVLGLPEENRYDFFLDEVVETGEIWGLGEQQWAFFVDESQGHQLFPIWSDQDFAEANKQGEWSNYVGKSFTVEQFTQELVPKLIQANVYLSVFKSPQDSGFIIGAHELKEILLAGMSA